MKQVYHMEVEMTGDGSPTLYLPGLDEHYHSVKGAVAESRHVYVEAAFLKSTSRPVRLLEVGFGTGLNAFLTLLASVANDRPVHYTSLELYPLASEQALALHYAGRTAPDRQALFGELHSSPWETNVELVPGFTLLKRNADLLTVSLGGPYDVIYFDAFAPEKQPELWEEQVLAKLFGQMASGGILSTYCAKGEVRRRLQRVGFSVERLPGPPLGKREILRAVK